MPHQIRLDLDEDNEVRPNPTMQPEREQHLIALMAEAILAVWRREQEVDHEAR
jgi:hypothetical protein